VKLFLNIPYGFMRFSETNLLFIGPFILIYSY